MPRSSNSLLLPHLPVGVPPWGVQPSSLSQARAVLGLGTAERTRGPLHRPPSPRRLPPPTRLHKASWHPHLPGSHNGAAYSSLADQMPPLLPRLCGSVRPGCRHGRIHNRPAVLRHVWPQGECSWHRGGVRRGRIVRSLWAGFPAPRGCLGRGSRVHWPISPCSIWLAALTRRWCAVCSTCS